jgi:hypothetical protein
MLICHVPTPCHKLSNYVRFAAVRCRDCQGKKNIPSWPPAETWRAPPPSLLEEPRICEYSRAGRCSVFTTTTVPSPWCNVALNSQDSAHAPTILFGHEAELLFKIFPFVVRVIFFQEPHLSSLFLSASCLIARPILFFIWPLSEWAHCRTCSSLCSHSFPRTCTLFLSISTTQVCASPGLSFR